MNLENKIESIMFYKNEPVKVVDLASFLDTTPEDISSAVSNLQEFYKDRGIVVVFDGEQVEFGTSPATSELIQALEKDELSRDLGRAGLETLAIVLYRAPISRRQIDYIRGVNSSYILRNLLTRGLVERVSDRAERSFTYKPTLELYKHLGITRKEDLPGFAEAVAKLEAFEAESDEVKQETNV